MNRSEISKKAWRKRKSLGLSKAKCIFCHKPIWAKGVEYYGKPFHKGCLEAKMIGLKPEHIGRNPRFYCPRCKLSFSRKYTTCPQCGKLISMDNPKRALRDGFRFYGAKALNPKFDRFIPYEPRHRKSKGTCYYCHYPIYAGGSQYRGKRYHETCLLLHKQKVPSSVMANPLYQTPKVKVGQTIKFRRYKGYGIFSTDTAKIVKVVRVGGDISTIVVQYPNGEKYTVKSFRWISKTNPEARPPREWMAEIIPGLKSSYPKATREQLGRLAAGIWWKWTPGQRAGYRERHGTAVANPKYEVYGRFKGLPMETELTHTIVTAKNKKEAESKGKKIIERIIGGDAVVSASKLDNPLLKGETYLGHTKRSVSVSEAKRKGYL